MFSFPNSSLDLLRIEHDYLGHADSKVHCCHAGDMAVLTNDETVSSMLVDRAGFSRANDRRRFERVKRESQYGIYLTSPAPAVDNLPKYNRTYSAILVAHDAEKPYYYIRFDMNNSGTIIVDGTMSINNGPLISYSPEDKAIFMIDQRAVKDFTSGNNVFCYSLVINGEEVYSYERYLLNYQQYRDELYSDGYQAMAYLLAAVLIMESGLFFKKEKLIKKGEIEECVA